VWAGSGRAKKYFWTELSLGDALLRFLEVGFLCGDFFIGVGSDCSAQTVAVGMKRPAVGRRPRLLGCGDRVCLKRSGCAGADEKRRLEAGAPGLGEFAAVAAGVFEEGEEVGHAEEGARGLVEVDEFEFAAAGAAGDVEGGERAEAAGVHMVDLLHVDDDAFFGGEQVADFVAELGRVVGGEFAVAFDDGGAFDAVGVEAESGGGLM
jgi:hypothetical protein